MYQILLIRRYLTSKIMPLLAALAVALCTAMVLVVWSVMGGFLNMLVNSGRTLAGDVIIECRPQGIGYYDELCADLEKDPLVAGAAPMIQTFGLVTFPDGRSKTVIVRGIQGASFARVTRYDELLWWRALDKPLPKDAKGEDPRLHVREPLARAFQNGLSLTRQDPGQAAPLPAAVMGIEVWGHNVRVGGAGYYIPGQFTHTAPDATSERRFMFFDGFITLHVLPMDASMKVIQVTSQSFPVANEFQSGLYEVDESTVFVELGALQRMLQMNSAGRIAKTPGGPYRVEIDPKTGEERIVQDAPDAGESPARATTILVRGKQDVGDEKALESLRDAVADAYGRFAERRRGMVPDKFRVDVHTWIDQNRTMIAAVKKETSLVLSLFSLISLTAVFLVLSIFWSMISEKTKDIGILRAMGAGRAGVAGLWTAYGGALGVVGAILGTLLAYAIVININPIHEWLGRALHVVIWDPRVYYFTTIPNQVDTPHAVMVFAGGVLSAVVGALIPAWRAARMDPVKSLRFE